MGRNQGLRPRPHRRAWRAAYPITATTFVLARKHPTGLSAAQSRALRQLFEWALFKGQNEAIALGYVPLPRHLAIRIEDYWLSEFPR